MRIACRIGRRVFIAVSDKGLPFDRAKIGFAFRDHL
jgi:hypothetical protein